jgi:diguanylate cyclase (GGDEF)-like protein
MSRGPIYFRWRIEQGRLVLEYAGEGWQGLLGIDRLDMAKLWAGIHVEDQPRVLDRIESLVHHDQSWTETFRWRRDDGTTQWLELSCAPESTANGLVWHTFARQSDEEAARIATFGRFDELTGLVNRGEFRRALEAALTDTAHPTALLFLDLDGFKAVNDRFGHGAGDEVLKIVAARLRGRVRQQDILARYGGDEFALVLHPVANREAAEVCARRILEGLSEPVSLRGQGAKIALTASLGLAIAPEDASTSDELVALADQRMYEAKRNCTGIETRLTS